MRYVSLFSGIEAASVAWMPLGWEPVAFAEFMRNPVKETVRPTPDTPRYKALGNSMAVPCMRWIGERIQMVDDMSEGKEEQ